MINKVSDCEEKNKRYRGVAEGEESVCVRER